MMPVKLKESQPVLLPRLSKEGESMVRFLSSCYFRIIACPKGQGMRVFHVRNNQMTYDCDSFYCKKIIIQLFSFMQIIFCQCNFVKLLSRHLILLLSLQVLKMRKTGMARL